jgi:hypothetical protein
MAGDLYAVKIKEPGMKCWEFLGSGGRLTTRRVHAQMGPKARAEEVAARIAAKYPDTQAKAVRL